MDQMEPLFPGIKIKLEIVENLEKKRQMKGLFLINAPYYLLIYSEDKERGMAECRLYYGTALPVPGDKGSGKLLPGYVQKEKRCSGGRDEIYPGAGFGKPAGPLLRQGYAARRLPLDELCVYKERPRTWVKEILEAARLAPSSINQQPWRFVVYENRVHVFVKKPSPLRAMTPGLTEFDMGVMLANVNVAADEIWVDLDLIKLDNITHKTLPNNQYLLSILLRE